MVLDDQNSGQLAPLLKRKVHCSPASRLALNDDFCRTGRSMGVNAGLEFGGSSRAREDGKCRKQKK